MGYESSFLSPLTFRFQVMGHDLFRARYFGPKLEKGMRCRFLCLLVPEIGIYMEDFRVFDTQNNNQLLYQPSLGWYPSSIGLYQPSLRVVSALYL